MKKIKSSLLTIVLLSSTITVNSNAYLIPAIHFDMSTVFKATGEMLMQNIEDSMTQWAQSTARNGVNAAASSMRSCLGDMDFGFMSSLGAANVKLPCGEAWSIDNPIDDIVNSVASDITSSLNNIFEEGLDAIVAFIDPRTYICSNYPSINEFNDISNSLRDFSRDKNIREQLRKSLLLQDDCGNLNSESSLYDIKKEFKNKKENDSQCACDEDLIGEELVSAFDFKVGDGSSAGFEMEEAKKYLDDVKREEMTKLNSFAIKYMDGVEPFSYIHYGGTIEEITMRKETAEFLSGDDKLNLQNEINELATEESRKARILKYNEELRIPFSFLTVNKRDDSCKSSSGGDEVSGIFDCKSWKEKTPGTSIIYLSPFDIFPEYPYMKSDGSVSYAKNPFIDGDKFVYKKIFQPEDLKETDSITPTQIKNMFIKEGVINEEGKFTGNFTHMNSMNILIESTNLFINQIQNKEGASVIPFVTWVYDKAIFNSNFIIADLLEKTRLLEEKTNSGSFNNYTNTLKESSAMRDADINKLLGQILTQIKTNGR